MIPTYTVESSRAPTDLCYLGAKYGTDKSPFNTVGHRHPYTPIYSFLFAPHRHRPIQFGEIGVAGGASVAMWSQYFTPSAKLAFYDCDDNFLANARGFGIPNASFMNMNVNEISSIRAGLSAVGGKFDILIDDSSHNVADQKNILEAAVDFMNPGGLLIVEDVFRNVEDKDYLAIIEPIKDKLSFYAFFVAEHTNKWSPGWDNDKILMMVRS